MADACYRGVGRAAGVVSQCLTVVQSSVLSSTTLFFLHYPDGRAITQRLVRSDAGGRHITVDLTQPPVPARGALGISCNAIGGILSDAIRQPE